MAKDVVRVMWCNTCSIPTNNVIEYRGTHQNNGTTLAVFHSTCCRCKVRNRAIKQVNKVPVGDYTALISKVIYV